MTQRLAPGDRVMKEAMSAEGLEVLNQRLNRWDVRRRLVESALWAPRGLLAGLLIAAVVAAAARFWPLVSRSELLITVFILGVTGVVFVLFPILFRRRGQLTKARFAEQAFGLQERMSTALEIAQGFLSTSPDLEREQLDNALTSSANLDEQKLLPLRLSIRDWILIFLSLVLLTAAVIVENPKAADLEQTREITKTIEEEIARLEGLEEQVKSNPLLTEEAQQEILTPIESALAELTENNPGREEAFAALSEAEADLRELGQNIDQNALQQSLENAAAPLGNNPASQGLGLAMQNGDLFAASSEANQLADQIASLNPGELTALAESLRQSSEGLQAIAPELAAQMASAAAALEESDREAAAEALREAAATLQQQAVEQSTRSQAAAAADQLAQGMEQLSQAGEQGSGQGQEGGTEGQGSGTGEQQGGSGSGSGSESGGSGGSESGGSEAGTEQGGGTGGPGPGGGHAENVYAPDLVALSGEAGTEIELPAECVADPSSCGFLLNETPTDFEAQESIVPYDQVFGDYRQAAYQALDETTIPLGLKGYIRDYFSSLEP